MHKSQIKKLEDELTNLDHIVGNKLLEKNEEISCLKQHSIKPLAKIKKSKGKM